MAGFVLIGIWFAAGLYVTHIYDSWISEIHSRKLRILVRTLITLLGVLVPVAHVILCVVFGLILLVSEATTRFLK